MRKRKICIVTGTRAEYGLLKLIINLVHQSKDLELQLVPSCMHLSSDYGLTINEIINDGFPITKSVDMLMSSNSAVGVTKSFGIGAISFADVFNDLDPDIVVILGDRFEALSAAIAALFAKIPIAHIHGGEITKGCFDDSIRHSITKMSHIHFVASEEYKNRIMQLGEPSKFIYNVGGLGVDLIKETDFLSKSQLEDQLNLKFKEKNLLITFHPVTLENDEKNIHFFELIKSLSKLNDVGLIFTMPNADISSKGISEMIKSFCEKKKDAYYFSSLGSSKYLSCMKIVNGVIGNSSSGLLEAPSLKIGTINIGNRQEGRLQASSIINCEPNESSIDKALEKLFSSKFNLILDSATNPYGNGGSSRKIFNVLKNISLKNIIQKEFIDL